MAYLGKVSWKVPVTPQVNTRKTRITLIIDGSQDQILLNICYIVTVFQWSGEAYFN